MVGRADFARALSQAPVTELRDTSHLRNHTVVQQGDMKSLQSALQAHGWKGDINGLLDQVSSGTSRHPIVSERVDDTGTKVHYMTSGHEVAAAHQYMGKPVPVKVISRVNKSEERLHNLYLAAKALLELKSDED